MAVYAPSLTKTLDLGTVIQDFTHPIYNSLGLQIGSFATDGDLASQNVRIFPNTNVPPPSQWIVKSFFGTDVSATEYLVGRGLQPSWLSAAQAQTVKAAQDKGVFNIPDAVLPSIDLTLPGLPEWAGGAPQDPFAPKPQINLTTLAVYGGLGILTFALVSRFAR